MTYPIYPDYDYSFTVVKEGRHHFAYGRLQSYIRKKFDGIYHLILLQQLYEMPIMQLKAMKIPKRSYEIYLFSSMFTRFTREAYRLLLFGCLTPKAETTDGRPVGFFVDPIQRTERERLLLDEYK